MLRTCANPNCKRGEGRLPKQFEPGKAWGLYCSKQCGDAVRRLRYYYKHKEAEGARTVYGYGPLKFSVGSREKGWLNISVEGIRRPASFWIVDTGLPEDRMVVDAILGLQDALINPEALFVRAGQDAVRQQEAKNLIEVAQEIGSPIFEASKSIQRERG